MNLKKNITVTIPNLLANIANLCIVGKYSGKTPTPIVVSKSGGQYKLRYFGPGLDNVNNWIGETRQILTHLLHLYKDEVEFHAFLTWKEAFQWLADNS